ncbi:T9SS type A sorting domain-containing protein [candidate division WOR-3 bacterium]|nr:T9SS type A sorting domain-containing protein [candidate division WOR-3 bacterium]
MKSISRVLSSMSSLSIFLTLVMVAPFVRAQWQNPVIDTITNTQVQKATTLQSLCLDDSGMVHIVWQEQVGGSWRVYYCTNRPAGTWGVPQAVGDTTQAASDPAVAWGSDGGVPFVVYEQNSDIYAAPLPGGPWEPITTNTQLDCSPTIAVDGTGYPHAAWITDDPGSGQYKIAYAVGLLVVGSSIVWDIQTLAGSNLGPYGTGASPFIAVTSDGVAHIVYRGGDYGSYHIHHAWNDTLGGTDWNYEILYSGNANDFTASMVIEGDGDLHLAVSGNDGWGFPGRVYYLYKPFGQSWQQHALASLGYSASQPSLSVDGNGEPHIVWMETSGNFYTGNIYYSHKQSGNWQVTSVIGTDHFVPSFGIDGPGYGHIACHTGGNTNLYDIYHIRSGSVLTGIEELEVPAGENGPGKILHNYPNPAKSYSQITYGNAVSGSVTLKVYSSAGQEIATLLDEFRPAGTYTVSWRPRDLSAGIYFIRLGTGGSVQTMKCVLVE